MTESKSSPEAEEILLSTQQEAEFPEDVSELNNISVKFAQSNRAHLESKKFCIYDKKFLQITSFKNNTKLQYWINLAYVNPKIDRKFIMNKLWLWLFILFVALAGVLYFVSIPESISILSQYKFSISVILLTLAFMSLVTLLGKARSVAYLRSSNGAAPMVEFLHNKPNKAAYNHFLSQLSTIVRTAKSKNEFDTSYQLAAELTEHRRLRDLGILSPEKYTQAKDLIFSLHSN